MQLLTIKLMSKNSKRTGIYIYTGVAEKDGRYYYATIPRQSKPLRKQDITDFTLTREIPKEFHAANGIG